MSGWELIHPVLQLKWEQLFFECHPWLGEILPIPKTAPSWQQYLEAFFLPTIENFRCCLGRKLSEFDELEIKFRSLCVRQKLKGSSILFDDHAGWLRPGDVCLISAENPTSKEVGASSQIWDGCGWLLVNSRDKGECTTVRCQIFAFDCNSDIVYAAVIDSATTTQRILKSIDFRNSKTPLIKEMFAEDNIHPDFKQLILSCQTPVTPLVSMATYDTRIHDLLSNLNDSQLVAVQQCIGAIKRSGSIELIQGPPGTGKTTCIVALLMALLLQSKIVIQTAPTNIAVLDLAKKLIAQKSPEVNPQKILIIVNQSRANIKELIDDELDKFVLRSRIHRLLKSTKTLIHQMTAIINTVCDAADANSDCEDQLQESCIKSILDMIQVWDETILISEFKSITYFIEKIQIAALAGQYAVMASKIQELALLSVKYLSQDLLGEFKPELVSRLEKYFISCASIIFCTISATKSVLLIPVPFEVAIVDEAAQAIEAEMLGFFKASLRTLILVGDPKQLHGTVFSQACLEAAYQRSLFERLASSHPVHLLRVQYRMHPSISAFPNATFYDGRIQDSPSVQSYNPSWYSEHFPPMRFIAHKKTECISNRNGSWYNHEESLLISLQLGLFLQTNPKLQAKIGVICPYSAQKSILEQSILNLKGQLKFSAQIKVSTVDGFQGQECDIIVFSLTRTGTTSNFVEQWNRMNVAVTRAKYALWVFGDQELFVNENHSRIWCRFAAHCKSNGTLTRIELSEQYANPETCSLAQRIVLTMKKQQLQKQPILTSTKKRPVHQIMGSRDHHIWSLIASEAVMKELTRCKNSTAHSYALLFSRLLMGDFREAQRPYRKSGILGKLFCLSKVENQLVLLWTIEIRLGSQVIYALRPLKKSQLAMAWNSFNMHRREYSDEYLAACAINLVSNAVPRTGLENVPKHFFRGAGADDAVSGSIKLFDLSDGPLIQMFSSADAVHRANFLIPYLLDEVQDKAVRYSEGSVVLVGRGGCGKTSVLAQRVLNKYKTAVMHDFDIPRQLFLSVSPMLIKNMKFEFDQLVHTFHSAYETELDFPEHSGCTFVSFEDLLFQLDSQIEPQHRLFYDKGSSRRIICQNLEEDDKDLSSRILYSARDIVDFDRFCLLYYPRLSDEARKVFAPEFIFTQIMFVIKGGNQTDSAGALSLKEYLACNEIYSGLVAITNLQRKLLYNAFRCYEKNRLKWHHIDYPDFISNISNRIGHFVAPFDFIYVDEVQDLMPCHWRLLDLFRHRKTQFVCCGDQAQCITAGNRFRFSRLKSFLFDSFGDQDVRPRQIVLTTNYRTIHEVLGLANRILDIIRYFFPNEIDHIEGERSARPPPDLWSGTPRLFEEDPADAISFLFANSKELAAEQVILVRDIKHKEALQVILKQSDRQGNVLTIIEAKGLEFEDVVVFNMLSSSKVSSQRLRVLLNFVSEANVQEFDICKHYELCHFLKELYVAVTRCKHRLLFIDDGYEAREIFVNVFQDLIQWTTIGKEMSFSRSSTIEDWACKALQYESAGLLREARNAFFKAEQFDEATRMEASILIVEFEKTSDPKYVLDAAELLTKINETELAATHLYDARQFARAAELYEKLIPGREQELIECFLLSGNYKQATEALSRYQPNLDSAVAVKIAIKLSHIIFSKSTVLLSDFFLVERILALFTLDNALQLSTIIKNLEVFVQKFCRASFDSHWFPRKGDAASILTAFISILVKFGWLDNGLIFFQSRFASEWTAAINELLKAAPNLNESQEKLRFKVVSVLAYHNICGNPAFKDDPKSSSVLGSTQKQCISTTIKDTVVSARTTCSNYLIGRIKMVWNSLSNDLGEDLLSNVPTAHSDDSAVVLSRLAKCLHAAVCAITLALSSKRILEHGENLVESIVLKMIKSSICHADLEWLRFQPILFKEAANYFLEGSNFRTTAAFLFHSVGTPIEAVSCFEHPGFEKFLLEQMKLSEADLDVGIRNAKYSNLAADFAAIGEYGRALFCIKKLSQAHANQTKQIVFQVWLNNQPNPSSKFNESSLSQKIKRSIQNVFNSINVLPKYDVKGIKKCYDNLPNPQAMLENETSAWFVERIIIWVLSSILPQELSDVSALAENLFYIVYLRTGQPQPFNPTLDFSSFPNGFILLEILSDMPDISFPLVRPIILFLFACSVVYVFLEEPTTGIFFLRNRSDVNRYLSERCIEYQAPNVFNQMKRMLQWLKNNPSAKKFKDVISMASEWNSYKFNNKDISDAVKYESAGGLLDLKRAAAIYRKLRLNRTQARLTKKIGLLTEKSNEANENRSRSTLPINQEAMCMPDKIDNVPAVSTHTRWSASQHCEPDSKEDRLQSWEHIDGKAISKKPEHIAQAS